MRYFRILIFSTIVTFSNGNSTFETNCLGCHITNQQLFVFMQRYTLKYSSETNIKNVMIEFLKNPQIENSIMPRGFLDRFGVKEKTNLDEKFLREAIDEYYVKYNIKNYIK
ncbi:MAG: hypothetical protein WCS26_06815 [Arcobacteraceae bacterium]